MYILPFWHNGSGRRRRLLTIPSPPKRTGRTRKMCGRFERHTATCKLSALVLVWRACPGVCVSIFCAHWPFLLRHVQRGARASVSLPLAATFARSRENVFSFICVASSHSPSHFHSLFGADVRNVNLHNSTPSRLPPPPPPPSSCVATTCHVHVVGTIARFTLLWCARYARRRDVFTRVRASFGVRGKLVAPAPQKIDAQTRTTSPPPPFGGRNNQLVVVVVAVLVVVCCWCGVVESSSHNNGQKFPLRGGVV